MQSGEHEKTMNVPPPSVSLIINYLVEEVLGHLGVHGAQHVVQEIEVRVSVHRPRQRHAGPLSACCVGADGNDRVWMSVRGNGT